MSASTRDLRRMLRRAERRLRVKRRGGWTYATSWEDERHARKLAKALRARSIDPWAHEEPCPF